MTHITMREEIWRDSYETVKDHEEFVRDHFKAECEEGLMEKNASEAAKARYGEKIAISSLSVLVEESHGNKEDHSRCRPWYKDQQEDQMQG